MFRRKQSGRIRQRRRLEIQRCQYGNNFKAVVDGIVSDVLFAEDRLHGNVIWSPPQLAAQGVIWAWQERKNVTDAFATASEVCEQLKTENAAKTHTSFLSALVRYNEILSRRLSEQFQALAEDVVRRFGREGEWVLIGFDGSRVTTLRTVSNEKEFYATNYGNGKTAKYRTKKTKRRTLTDTTTTNQPPSKMLHSVAL